MSAAKTVTQYCKAWGVVYNNLGGAKKQLWKEAFHKDPWISLNKQNVPNHAQTVMNGNLAVGVPVGTFYTKPIKTKPPAHRIINS